MKSYGSNSPRKTRETTAYSAESSPQIGQRLPKSFYSVEAHSTVGQVAESNLPANHVARISGLCSRMVSSMEVFLKSHFKARAIGQIFASAKLASRIQWIYRQKTEILE